MTKEKKIVLVIDYETKETLGIVEWNESRNDFIFTSEIGISIDENRGKKIHEIIRRLKNE